MGLFYRSQGNFTGSGLNNAPDSLETSFQDPSSIYCQNERYSDDNEYTKDGVIEEFPAQNDPRPAPLPPGLAAAPGQTRVYLYRLDNGAIIVSASVFEVDRLVVTSQAINAKLRREQALASELDMEAMIRNLFLRENWIAEKYCLVVMSEWVSVGIEAGIGVGFRKGVGVIVGAGMFVCDGIGVGFFFFLC